MAPSVSMSIIIINITGPGQKCPDARTFEPLIANPASHGLKSNFLFIDYQANLGENYLLHYLIFRFFLNLLLVEFFLTYY